MSVTASDDDVDYLAPADASDSDVDYLAANAVAMGVEEVVVAAAAPPFVSAEPKLSRRKRKGMFPPPRLRSKTDNIGIMALAREARERNRGKTEKQQNAKQTVAVVQAVNTKMPRGSVVCKYQRFQCRSMTSKAIAIITR